jgi:hypothetical protein
MESNTECEKPVEDPAKAGQQVDEAIRRRRKILICCLLPPMFLVFFPKPTVLVLTRFFKGLIRFTFNKWTITILTCCTSWLLYLALSRLYGKKKGK